MRPLTYETPKQMLPLVGVPMIECVFQMLARHGITDAVLALGYLPDRFIEAYPSGVIAGVNVTYAVEPEPLDTSGAIRFAATFAKVDETFLVVNGDVLTDLDITKLIELPPRSRCPGDHRPAPRGRPLALRRRTRPSPRGASSPSWKSPRARTRRPT